MSHSKITSAPKLFTIILLVVGTLALLGLSVGQYILAFDDEYADVILFLVATVLGGFGLKLLTMLVYFKHVTVHEKSITIKTLIDSNERTIPLHEIRGYIEVEKKGKNNQAWHVFTIFTVYEKIEISSQLSTNYTKMVAAVKRMGVKEDLGEKKRYEYKQKRMIAYASLALSGFLLMLACSLLIGDSKAEKLSDLVEVKGTVAREIVLVKGSKGRMDLDIRLKEYPKFLFDLDHNAIRATNIEHLTASKSIGDSIKLHIQREQYEKKLAKLKPMNFWDKGFHYRTISVYGIRDDGYEYLPVDKYSTREEPQNGAALAFFIIMLLPAGVGVYLLKNNKEPYSG